MIIFLSCFVLGDGARLRDYVVELGIIRPLMELIQKDISITFLRNVTWVFVNLCRHKDPSLSINAAQEILPALKYLLSLTDNTVSIINYFFYLSCKKIYLDSY